MVKKMKKYMILIMITMIGVMLPEVSAVANTCNISVEDSISNVALGGEILITNEDTVTFRFACSGNGTVLYELYEDDGATGIYLDKSTTSTIFNDFDITGYGETDGDPVEFYIKAMDEDGAGVPVPTESVFVERDTIAADVVRNLSVSDESGVVSNAGDVTPGKTNDEVLTLSWEKPIEEPASYEVSYRRGISNRIIINDLVINTVSSVVTTPIEIGPDDMALVDGVLTFSARGIEAAGNVSSYEDVVFEYDTTPPSNINNSTMKDENLSVIYPDGVNDTETINLSWTEPNGEEIDHYNVYIKEGDDVFVLHSSVVLLNVAIDALPLSDGTVTFKVTSVDVSGNESLGSQTYFTLDTVAPVFSVTYDLGGDGVNTHITGATVNFAEKSTIDVVNGANDIIRYSISTVADNYKNGDYSDLEDAIKNVSSDGLYTIKIQDMAGNIGSLSFTFDQVYPDIPDNRYIDVTSVDEEDLNGIQSTVTITWDKSTDDSLDHYELWINGELDTDDISQPPTGSIVTEAYSFDTIKYGDVTNYYEIRTVDGVGNFGKYSVRKHIITDLVRPNATIISTNSTDEEIFFNVKIEDPNRDVDSVYAYLYKNSQFIKSISLTIGTNEYSFSNLENDSSDYKIEVSADYDFNGATYDADDADGIINVNTNGIFLNAGTIDTLDTLGRSYDVSAQIVSANKNDTSISLEINSLKDSTSNESLVVQLWNVDGQVDFETITLDTDDLTTTSEISFNSLVTGTVYQIRIIEDEAIIATHNFSTEKDMPSAAFKINTIEQNTLDISIIISDEDGSSAEKSVVLLEDGQIVPNKTQSLSVGTNNVSFGGLDDNSEYEYKVYASYNLENGRGAVIDDVIGTFELYTAKPIPVVRIYDVKADGNSVSFDTDIRDSDNSIISVKAVLYDGAQSTGKEVLLNKGILLNREFDDLDPVKDYRINIVIEYDLNDNNDSVDNPLFYGSDFETLKLRPTIEVRNLDVLNTSADFSAIVIDPNEAYISGFIKLYSTTSNIPIEIIAIGTSTVKEITFEDLKAETTYRIKIDTDINVGDGEENNEIIYSTEFTTLPNINVDMDKIDKTYSTISFDVDFINNIEAVVVVRLLLGDDILEEAIIENGSTSFEFTNLLDNTSYNISIDYLDGSGTLVQSQVLTERIISLTVPEVFIVQSSLDVENIVTLRATIVDVDGTVNSDVVEIRICSENGLCSVQEISISSISEGVEVELPYSKNIISVVVSYDAGDHEGVVADSTETIERVENEPDTEEPSDPIDTDEPGDGTLFGDTTMLILVGVLAASSLTALGYIIYTKKS